MTKKCIICGQESVWCIKDSSEYYCEECAKEHFGEVSYLVKVEEQAKQLKEAIEQKTKKEFFE